MELKETEIEQTTIRLPIGLKKEVQQEADRCGISFNAAVIKLLLKALSE